MSSRAQVEAVRRLAEKWEAPYLPREEYSLQELQDRHGLDYILTLDKDMRLYIEEPAFRWHPSFALVRFRNLLEGKQDTFLSAAGLSEGDSYLDCTLGLGADAILAASAIGEAGEALGLEASPIIALLTGWGLENEAKAYHHRKSPLAPVAGRIRVHAGEALDYLHAQPDCRWDVIYFDPMFRASRVRSDAMNSMRPMACHKPFDAETLKEALRVCRRRVVLKERWFSPLFQTLGADRMVKTKYGPVAYGIWDKDVRA